MPRNRPYLFYDTALTICSVCYRRIDGKILIQDDGVYLRRRCPQHGWETVLLADDVDYYRRSREVYIKPPEMPARYATPIRYGCPYDCGLCPDHEQHSCLSIVEITDHCNLSCPICYANSGPERKRYRSYEQVLAMLDAVVASEGEADVVQISGGEPTLHPEFFAILDAARERPIRHLMVNTNGVRIARDGAFVDRLAAYGSGFEVYLQFDSFEAQALSRLRGADLRDIRQRAVERLNAAGISTTLVATVARGVNDGELGGIVDWALEQPSVRGVTFQPVQVAGRTEGFDPARDRLTLTEVRRRLLEQSDIFSAADVIPVPCHPDAIAMAYALKTDEGAVPLSGVIPTEVLLDGGRNTISFERESNIRDHLFSLFATNLSPESQAGTLKDLLCCLPRVTAPTEWRYDRLFRIIIMAFIDAYSFDLRSVKKSCVHFVHPDDGRMIPFDTYNLFFRDELEAERLEPIRKDLRAQGL
jgi:uncharacterized radical SAM superfamily Fe-S cluster-containing enzyme